MDMEGYSYASLTQQMVVGLALILERQTAVRDVVQVLQPLEERHRHTTGVNVQIGNDQDVAVNQDLVRSGRCRSVGSLSDDLKEIQIKASGVT